MQCDYIDPRKKTIIALSQCSAILSEACRVEWTAETIFVSNGLRICCVEMCESFGVNNLSAGIVASLSLSQGTSNIKHTKKLH